MPNSYKLVVTLSAPVPVILYEDAEDGGNGNSEEDSKNRMNRFREADSDKHCEDDGDGRKPDRSSHDQRNKEIILAPLNAIVHHAHDECGEEPELRQCDEDRGIRRDDRPDHRKELGKERKNCKSERVGHAQKRESNEDEKPDGEGEHDLPADPLCKFYVNRLRFAIRIPPETVGQEYANPPENVLFFELKKETEHENKNEPDHKLHHRSRHSHNKDNGSAGSLRKILSEFLYALQKSACIDIGKNVPQEPRKIGIDIIADEGDMEGGISKEDIDAFSEPHRHLLNLFGNNRNERYDKEEEKCECNQIDKKHREPARDPPPLQCAHCRINDDREEHRKKQEEKLIAQVITQIHGEEDCQNGECSLGNARERKMKNDMLADLSLLFRKTLRMRLVFLR